MTIPDIGHCVGSGADPAQGSVDGTGEGQSTGVCPACSGRFELHPSGVMGLHDAAEVDEREVLEGSFSTSADLRSGGELGMEDVSRGYTAAPGSPGPGSKEP